MSARLGCVGICLLSGLIFLTGCEPGGSIKMTLVSRDRSLEETEVYAEEGLFLSKVAIIDVDGVIMNGAPKGFMTEGEHPVSLLVEKLDAARKDRSVKAVVLRINSPGGTVTASEIMHEEILRFRKSGKPVVTMMMDVAASGGYYIACASDEIIAYPSTVTGSIGVIAQMIDLSGTMNKIGLSMNTIKSGPNKDAGSPFRPMSEPEHAIFQKLVDEYYNRFVDVVAKGRPKLTREQIVQLADGRVYTGAQAVEAGLVDRLGGLHDAVDAAKKRAHLDRCRVVSYHRPEAWDPNIYAESNSPAAKAPTISLLGDIWPSWLRPGNTYFMYLWVPNS